MNVPRCLQMTSDCRRVGLIECTEAGQGPMRAGVRSHSAGVLEDQLLHLVKRLPVGVRPREEPRLLRSAPQAG